MRSLSWGDADKGAVSWPGQRVRSDTAEVSVNVSMGQGNVPESQSQWDPAQGTCSITSSDKQIGNMTADPCPHIKQVI